MVDLHSQVIVLQGRAEGEQVRESLEVLQVCCDKIVRELAGTLLEGVALESNGQKG